MKMTKTSEVNQSTHSNDNELCILVGDELVVNDSVIPYNHLHLISRCVTIVIAGVTIDGHLTSVTIEG